MMTGGIVFIAVCETSPFKLCIVPAGVNELVRFATMEPTSGTSEPPEAAELGEPALTGIFVLVDVAVPAVPVNVGVMLGKSERTIV